ncbi:haloacid dehalogenase-like hydrolase [Truncatella angustata]|uniref:Haloacid dehalogenase-like hydrolase n=1 Tax=Truncatella angustata TaxID=152316 RepID=A0A9P8UP31_9PEZI|nr:haloacid dehalogenase-like hydrolase [Truncatella angustata]KAH6655648.1 haloacid dehalogenase-like hydrolase [Truncatella angustata]
MTQPGPRRFAPLKQGAGQTRNLPKLKGVVFDVDGTLCKPQNHMFVEMRDVLGIPKSIDILDHIYSLSPASKQEEAMESIRAIERRNMSEQIAQPGLAALMAYLDSRSVRKGICTRNFDGPVTHLLGKFLPSSVFEPIITRDFRPPKPDPAGILFIARSWGLSRPLSDMSRGRAEELKGLVRASDEGAGVRRGALAEPEEGGNDHGDGEEIGDARGLIMVGDSIDDMAAGRRAGAATVLLVNSANEHLAEHEDTDLVIRSLDELVDILEDGFVGRVIS